MKQRLIILVALMLLSTGILFALNLASDGPNKQDNGFKRLMLPNAEEVARSDKLTPGLTNICGFSGDSVFLACRIPGKIYVVSGKLKLLDSVMLPLPNIAKLAPVFYTTVQFPGIYILAGNAKKLISGNLLTKEFQVKDLPVGPFGNGITVNENCQIFRALDTALVSSVFIRANAQGQVVTTDSNISERLHDAGFTHDGLLTYEIKSGNLFYVDYYSNNVTCFDTNLKLIYQSHTVDTSYQSLIKVGFTKGKYKSSGPLAVINRFGSMSRGLLFIISNLKADNEGAGKFRRITAIDRYSTVTGQYSGSFYLPVRNDRKLKAFKIYKNKCYVLCDHQIIQYRIP